MSKKGATMNFRIEIIQKDFTPSEAAGVTGVSTALQRDWRRHRYLSKSEDGGWARHDLSTTIKMIVMKTFSDAGNSVSAVKEFAIFAILPTLNALKEIDGAVEFEGDELREDSKKGVIDRIVVGATGRYLVMTSSGGEEQFGRLQHASEIGEFLDSHGTFRCSVIDCRLLAAEIALKAGLPLFRVKCRAVEGGDTVDA
jgi:hypothetical protein